MDNSSADCYSHRVPDDINVGLISVGDDSFDEFPHSEQSLAVMSSERSLHSISITPSCGVEFSTGVLLGEEVGDRVRPSSGDSSVVQSSIGVSVDEDYWLVLDLFFARSLSSIGS